MLRPEQVELIHRELDGDSTPESSAAFRALLLANADARALASELREMQALLDRVQDRPPPPHLRSSILAAIRNNARAAPQMAPAPLSPQSLVRWFTQHMRSVTTRMEEAMLMKKALVFGGAAVAVIAIVGLAVTGYPPSGRESGTIGGLSGSGSDTIGAVQQASRYRNRSVTERDVTLANPEIQVLFQNHEILALVKSDVFRNAMRNDAFRSLQFNDAFRQLAANDAFRTLMANDAFRQLQSNDAFRAALASENLRSLQGQEFARQLEATEAFRALQANDAFRALLASDAFRAVLLNDAFRAVMANDAFRAVMANDAFRKAMATDAYFQLQSADIFRSLSRSAQASEAFLSVAMRAAQ